MAKLQQQRGALTRLFLLVLLLSAISIALLLHQFLRSPFSFPSCSTNYLLPHMRSYTNGPSSEYRNISSWEGLDAPPQLTLQELFSTTRTPTSYPSDFPHLSPLLNPNFTSHFLPFPRHHKQHAIRNACIEPNGRLLLVNVTPDEFSQALPPGARKAPYQWYVKYSKCGNVTADECVGVRSVPELPTHARYVPGNTMHFIAYFRGNTLHNFAERVWPRLALSVLPFNETTQGLPVHHFFFHRINEILEQASFLDDKDQVLWQFRMLMELWPGSDLLRVAKGDEGDEKSTMCFDTLLLQMHDDDRMDHTRLPPAILEAAVLNYRSATFRFLKLSTVSIPLPPRPLRLLYYGRGERTRRRAVNHDEVLHFLQHNMSRLHLEIRSLDLLLFSKQMDYSFQRLVSIFSQTDILVIAHGAMTWAMIFLPLSSGVIEVFGSCDWWKPKGHFDDPTPMNSWAAPLARGLHLKHDLSNPYRESVANPQRGNTTLCVHPGTGVPDFTIDPLKLGQAIDSLAYPQEPGDILTLHWLYDWSQP